jgi:NAD(P)-dependent dehydrogenase (short-subunit alcohol dehydrogenase family)
MTNHDQTNAFDPRRIALTPNALAGRVIAITGASGGIGQAVALGCAKAGAEVILLGRNVKKLESVHAQIESLGTSLGIPSALISVLDLERAIAKDYDELTTAVEERWGRLDGLVHTAGLLGQLSAIEHQDVPTWIKVLHVNVTAMFTLTQAMLPLLRAAPSASVICTSSSVGRKGRAFWGAYAVSKFALEGFVQVLADELEQTRVRVNSLNPGPIRTAMRRQAYPAEDPKTLPAPETVVASYLALLSDAAEGVSGQAFNAFES